MPAVIIVVVILITAGGGPAKRPPPAKLPPLVQTYASTAIGVKGLLPSDWSAIRGPGFVRLSNRANTSEIVIAAPSTTDSALKLIRATLASIHHDYPNVTEKAAPGRALGGLPARSEVVFTSNQHHVPIRILVAVARGKRLRYIVEAFNNQHAPLHDLVETQQIILTMRLAG